MFFGRLQIFERGKIFRVKSFFLLFVVVYIFSVVRKMNRVVNLVTMHALIRGKGHRVSSGIGSSKIITHKRDAHIEAHFLRTVKKCFGG